MDRPTCETWSDHEFGRTVLVASGTHPTRGGYTRHVRTCSRCGRKTEETRWANETDNTRITMSHSDWQ